ncbi:stage III sporulation protein SpoIIIAB [Gorillibacterium massiliense]|uniref:stage III sporulation protein SpoIIIAB n=1 Tax=Gorillibacterium massiliense TaxID=1280390 RepID=UPI0004B82C19|nr:stage III sporulation protein SpoIIIAB [Gorillibacterium massiliense]
MLKLLGAMIVILAGGLLGYYQSIHLARRPRQIRQLILALQRLETEVLYGASPLPEALLSVSRPLPDPLRSMFNAAGEEMSRHESDRTAADSWKKAMNEYWPRTSMKGPEQETMRQLGFSLGISDREDQIKHIRLATGQLLAEEKTAAEDGKRYGSMWRSLGVLGATLVVIIMY